MSKIPKHLQEKIEQSGQMMCIEWPVEVYTPSDLRLFYEKGAAAMHALMLEELKLITKMLEEGSEMANKDDVNGIAGELAQKALDHYNEKIAGGGEL